MDTDEPNIYEKNHHQEALEFLSNLTPGSYLYNETVQKLRRNKRKIENIDVRHDKINLANNTIPLLMDKSQSTLTMGKASTTTASTPIVDVMELSTEQQKQLNLLSSNSISMTVNHTTATTSTFISSTIRRKINSNKNWRKGKNHGKYKHKNWNASNNGHSNTHKHTPVKISTLVFNSNGRRRHHDCNQLNRYALLIVGLYIAFTFALYNFLLMSESAVFSAAVLSAALPVAGIFWSMFQLATYKIGKLSNTRNV